MPNRNNIALIRMLTLVVYNKANRNNIFEETDAEDEISSSVMKYLNLLREEGYQKCYLHLFCFSCLRRKIGNKEYFLKLTSRKHDYILYI